MKRFSTALLLLLSISIGVANPPAAFAEEIDEQPIKHTIMGPGSYSWSNLNQNQLNFLKENAQFLEFQGAVCKVTTLSGCRVVKSENPTIPIGDYIRIKVVNQQTHATTSAAFQASCSWCGYVITSIEIVAFVVAAPTMTPAWMLYTTYFIGSSIIGGNL